MMKTVAVVLTILFISIPSVVAGAKKDFQALKNQIKHLEKEVKAISDKIGSKDPYVKLNSAPVCFGAKDKQYGGFNVLAGGKLIKVKLVHLYGYVTCAGNAAQFWSYWGCGYFNQIGTFDWTSLSVTDASDTILLPPSEINRGEHNMALVPGYNSRSPEIVMSVYETPIEVNVGEDLRIWYTEDLEDHTTGDNSGRVCADVYGYFI